MSGPGLLKQRCAGLIRADPGGPCCSLENTVCVRPDQEVFHCDLTLAAAVRGHEVLVHDLVRELTALRLPRAVDVLHHRAELPAVDVAATVLIISVEVFSDF